MKVEEISNHIGFKQRIYFTKCCKAKYKLSPLECRKQYSSVN
ncbi:hypothetical protein [Staphylococcus haemolyticus]|nr:hypothetical protein [Staphylococcus haemolyticus]